MGRWGWRWRVGLVALLLVAAQGCWLQTGFGYRRAGTNSLEETVTAANVAGLEAAWTATVSTDDRPPGDVVVWGDTAYVRMSRAVTALDTASGAQRWTVGSLDGDAGPAVADDRLWVPASGGTCLLVALDLATGGELDRQTFGGPDLSNLGNSGCGPGDALAVGTKVATTWVYFGSSPAPRCPQGAWALGSGLTVFNPGDPTQGWGLGGLNTGCGTPFPPPSSIPSHLAPSSDGGSVFAPVDEGLAAYPVADCGRTTAGGSCRPTWSRTIGAGQEAQPVALESGDLAVSAGDGQVVVLDAVTGEPQWTGDAGAPLAAPLAATSTTIFAATEAGTIAAFPVAGCGQDTCQAQWTATTSAPASAQPSIGGDVLYVGDAAGRVTALPAAGCGAATCEALWTASVAESVTGSPVISDGTLYVPGSAMAEGGAVGTVTAFRLPEPG